MQTVEATRRTYYVVQSFSRDGRALRMDAPIQAATEASARRAGERLAARKAAVIVFGRSGNPESGEFDEPEVLAKYGVNLEANDDLPF